MGSPSPRFAQQAENIRVRCRLSINGWCHGRPEDEGICPEMMDITVVAGNTMTEQSFPVTKAPYGRLSKEEFEKQGGSASQKTLKIGGKKDAAGNEM